MSVAVCLSVCLSVLLHSSKTDTFKLHQIFDAGHSRQWLGFVWRRRCDKLCTSGYTNDVILTDNGRNGGISELTYYLLLLIPDAIEKKPFGRYLDLSRMQG